MPFSVDDTPFGSLSVTLADVDGTLSASIMATAPATLSLAVYGAPPGVPSDGLEGQILAKATDAAWDTIWIDNYATELRAVVRNQTGATLTKGTVVYISGGAGNKPLVTKASAATESGSSKTFAILAEDIPDNQNGEATTLGLLSKVDTSAFTAGANLWLSTTAGEITETMPTTPNHAVFIGNAVRIHATQGEIMVRIQNGLELGELHDVLITTPTDGQVLKFDAATSLWKNGTDVGGVAWGGITGTLSNQTDLQNALDAKASLSGATFTGKIIGTASATDAGVNLGTVNAAPSNLTEGDIWITDRLSYRNRNGNTISTVSQNQTNNITTSANASFVLSVTQNGNGGAVRVINNGTGESFRVDDETPESTPFVISSDGRVGIGVTPDATAALAVDAGGIKFDDATVQTTAFVSGVYAPLASPVFTGNPTAPTPATADNDTSIATTAFVKAQGYLTASTVDVQVFGGPSSSGNFTWNKPTGAQVVEVFAISGGGGGGSGARQLQSVGRWGGGGGGGSGAIFFKIAASLLGSSETVTVGAGGSGGAAVTTDSTNGNNGTKGGDSVFGPITARGGNFGSGGTTSTGTGGSASLNYFWLSPSSVPSQSGGNAPSAAASLALQYYAASSGGGGGASRGAGVALPSAGGNGGSKLASTSVSSGLTTAIAGGAGGIGGTSTPATAGIDGGYWGSTGGGGGYYRPNTTGDAGGAGGWPGGGGGGGGCSDDGYDSGAGGAGGNGLVIVITYCT